MSLKEIQGAKSWIYAERYLNGFKKVANEISLEYCAINGLENFNLPFVDINLNKIEALFAYPTSKVFNKVIKNGKARFFIHPDSLHEFGHKRISGVIKVSPTSSTRTVYPLKEDFCIKLHLNRRLSRFIRRLRAGSVEHSILISSEIECGLRRAPKSFAYLPESVGFVYEGKGVIIREMTPRPRVKEKRFFLPLFSMYSTDLKNANLEPLFVQIVTAKKLEPLRFFLDSFIDPILKNISYFLDNYGVLLECHGQNVLVEFDSKFNVKRMIHRDFQSIYIDSEIRKKKGLPEKFSKHIMGTECPKEISYSVVYDQYLGGYVFDSFVKLISEKWDIPKEKIRLEIKKRFLRHLNNELFPKEGYYLMKKGEFKDNNTEFEFYAEKPAYRP